MRVVIDLQSCQSGSKLGGIGRYSMNLLRSMLHNSGLHEFHVVLSGLMADSVEEIYTQLNGLIDYKNIHVFHVPGPVFESEDKNKFRARSAELVRENYIYHLKPDIVHVTSLIEGLGDNATTSVGRLLPGSDTAVTLYDLIPLVDHGRYLTNYAISSHYFRKLEDLQYAGLLLSISEFSRNQAMEELGFPGECIVNISSAVDEKFKPRNIPEGRAQELKRKYKIKDKFLMYTGSFDYRKNHETLVKALGVIDSDLRKNFQLVIVGNGWDGVYKHLRWVADEAGLSKDELIFAGKVPDEDLLDLYNICHLFVFPSLSEGFGLPVLEAMSCGTPVIGSGVTSIPEVIGFDDALFDPTNEFLVADKIYQVITNDNFRRKLSEHGLKQSEKFSWEISAKKAIGAFESYHERRVSNNAQRIYPVTTKKLINAIASLPESVGATKGDIEQLSHAIAMTEQLELNEGEFKRFSNKVGLVTTWNTRCGIALSSEHLVGNMSQRVEVFAPHSNGLARPDNKNVHRCWELGASDSLDNLFGEIQEKEIGAIVIQFNYGFFEFYSLNNFINELIESGVVVLIVLHSTSDPEGYDNKELKILADSLSRCHKILVHTKRDVARLSVLGLNNVKLFPLGVLDYEPSASEAREGDIVLASYGFFLPHKGLLELIDAIAILRQRGLDVRLEMINAEYPAEVSTKLIAEAKQKISDLDLVGVVNMVTDFLTDKECLSRLSSTDLIVFPYQKTGESASAAVRYGLVSKKPVAVTPLSIFDDVASAVFCLPGYTPDEIADGISVLVDEINNNSTAFQNKMMRLGEWVEEHRYSTVGKKLEALVTHLMHEKALSN